MAVKRIVTPEKHIGLSSDTKPTHQRAGATFYEYDTDLMFITYDDGTNWVLKKDNTNETSWRYGTPTLHVGGNGRASWVTSIPGVADSHFVGWAARLDGGVQTSWNDFAKVNIPVNEIPFADLDSVVIEAYYTATSGIDMGVCVYLHDPDDNDETVELSHTPYTTSAAGWRELDFPTEPGGTSWFWYGDVTATPDTCPTEGTAYTWAQFKADSVFSTWVISKISLDYGYYTGGGTMDGCFLTKVFINGESINLKPMSGVHKKKVTTTKALAAASAYDAEDVLSETATNTEGTDWDFNFGGTGYITSAQVISATTALTPRLVAFLFSAPPSCELDDHAASNAPLAADLAYCLGQIEFPAMVDRGTGMSYAMATPSTYGNLPILFDVPIIYAVLVTLDAFTQGAGENMTLILGADMEDN